MKRNIITQLEAQTILTPYYAKISKAVCDGFEDYLKIANCSADKVGYVNYETRTKACIIHDHIKNRIDEAFQDVPEVETGKWNDVFALKINDDLFIRFNKINDDFTSKGRRTKQAKDYKNQMTIEGFPDEPTLLYAGYKPDASWTQIKGVYITCWNGESRQWIEEIISHRSSAQTSIPFEPQEQENPKRVKIKIDQKPETKTGTNE